jgi:Phage stabilisation protein
MAAIPLSFGLQSNRGRFLVDSSVSVVNAYAEPLPEGSKAQVGLYAAPGLKPWLMLPKGPFRGCKVVQGVLYVVSGGALYAISAAGTATVLGSISGYGQVSIASNALAVADIVIVADGTVYLCKGSVLSTVHSDALPPPVDVTFLRGRFVYAIADGRFYFTDINSTNVDGLAFYNAEGMPDGLVAIKSRRGELWLFGTESLEIWGATQDNSEPFTPMGGGSRPYGCIAAGSINTVNDMIIWIDNETNVRMAAGYSDKGLGQGVISTAFISRMIDAEPDKESITSETFSVAGTNYYQMSGSTFTLTYSLATQQWTERTTHRLKRWRGVGAVTFAGQTIVGDHATGQLYALDMDHPYDGDEPVVMRLVSPIMHAWPMPLSIYSLHLDCLTGVGTRVIDDPEIMLRLSEDGGKTWFGPIMERLGGMGEARRVIWRQLGTFERRGAVVEVSISAAVAKCVLQAVINGEAGST